MVAPQTLLAGIDAVGWTLLHFLWQGALLGAAYALARPLCSAVAARYRLGLIALSALAACPVATLVYLWPAHGAAAGGVVALPGQVVTATDAAPAAASGNFELWLPYLVGAWFLGASFIALRAFTHWRRLSWLVRHAAIPLPDCAAVLERLARRFGIARRIRLLATAGVDTPMLVGWLRPVILLPLSMLSGFTPQQIELIIAHELGHVRRWDYLANLLQVVIETVLFYHPVVHWISRDVRDARESCCDDLVLALGEGSPVVYASTLADLEQLRHDSPLAAPALAASGGVLLTRIRRIVGVQHVLHDPLPRNGSWPIALLAAAGLLAVMRLHAPPSITAALVQAPAASLAAISGNARIAQPAPVPVMTVHAPAVAAAPPAAPVPRATTPPAGDAPRPVAEPIAVAPLERPRLALATPAAPAIAAVRDIREPLAALPLLTTATTAPAAAAVEAPVVLQRVQPEYPRHEKLRGVTGEVELEFAIAADGSVRDVSVAHSTPERVFDAVAIAALKKWKFAAGSGSSRYTQSFTFTIGAPPAAADSCREVTGSHICRHTAGGEDVDAEAGVKVFH